MIFNQPTKQIKNEKTSVVTNGYHTESDEIKTEIKTIPCGWEKFHTGKSKRFIYVLDGWGVAELNESEKSFLTTGSIIEVPERTSVYLHGQLKYALVTGGTNVRVQTSEPAPFEEHLLADKTQHILILDGLGNLSLGKEPHILRTNSFAEVNKDVEATLQGTMSYVIAE